MSYIRSTSNPESLYIYSDGNTVHIHIGNAYRDRKKHYKEFCLPERVFDKLIKKSKGWLDAEWKGAKVEEKYIRKHKKLPKWLRNLKMTDGDFQTRLSYADWYIDMWKTTWFYICN